MGRCGSGASHCCWLGEAGACRYVVPSTEPGFNWACSLRLQKQNWAQVHKMPEYIEHVQPFWDNYSVGGNKRPGLGCGTWPPPGLKCNDCGEVG